MTSSPHRIRIGWAMALVLAVVALAAPAAQAAGAPDAVDRYLRSHPQTDLRSPDRKFPPRGWPSADAVDRAVTNGYGAIPDAIDRYLASHGGLVHPIELRSPDTRDAGAGSIASHGPIVVAASGNGVDWTDAALGAGVAFALVLLVGGVRQTVGHKRAKTRSVNAPLLPS